MQKENVDNLNIIDIANEFGCTNESRLSTFGKFCEHDFQTRSDNSLCLCFKTSLFCMEEAFTGEQNQVDGSNSSLQCSLPMICHEEIIFDIWQHSFRNRIYLHLKVK